MKERQNYHHTLFFFLLIFTSITCERFIENFGEHEWKREFMRGVKTVLPAGFNANCVIYEDGIRIVSSTGSITYGTNVEWKQYAVVPKDGSVYFVTRDNQVQTFSCGNGKFVRTEPIEDGEDIHDIRVDTNGEDLVILRTNKLETYSLKAARPSILSSSGLSQNIIAGGILSQESALVAYKKDDRICVSISSNIGSSSNCVSFLTHYRKVDSNSRFIIFDIDGKVIAFSSTNHQEIAFSDLTDTIAISSESIYLHNSLTKNIEKFGEDLESTTFEVSGDCGLVKVPKGTASSRDVYLGCFESKTPTSGRLVVSRVGSSVHDLTFTIHQADQFRLVTSIYLEYWKDKLETPRAFGFDDESLRVFTNGVQVYSFDNGLARIKQVHQEEFIDDSNNASNEAMARYLQMSNPIQRMFWRYAQDLVLLKNAVSDIVSLLSDFTALKNKILNGDGNNNRFLTRYGLRKQLILLTQGGCVYSIDSHSSKTMWMYQAPQGSKVLRVLKGLTAETIELQYQQLENNKPRTFSVQIKLENGKQEGSPIGTYFNGDSLVWRIPGAENRRIEVDIQNNKIFSTAEKRVFAFDVKKSGVYGYNIKDSKYVPIWNIHFAETENPIAHSYHLKGHDNYYSLVDHGFHIGIPESNSLMYKVIDSHNIVIATKETLRTGDVMNLYIINTKRGTILAQYTNTEVDFSKSINVVYDSNAIFISYFNKGTKAWVIWSFEIMRNEIESVFTEMLNKYVFRTQEAREPDYNNYIQDYVLLERKYTIELGIKKMKPVVTREGLTKSNLIVITDNNDIYSLDRLLVSARRMDKVDASGSTKRVGIEAFQSALLPQYDYVIPTTTKAQLNSILRLTGIRDVDILETQFESTSLVLAHGCDMFFSRVNPDGNFDVLSDSFNQYMLAAVVVLIAIVTYVLGKLAKAAATKRKFFSA